MQAFLLEWLSLLLRWAHVAAAIAWIGAAFYFVWLDNRLTPAHEAGLTADLWTVQDGALFRTEKVRLTPAPQLPGRVHAFKWEAYWTWLTGFALLVALYYAHAERYLIDPAVMPLSKWAAIAISLAWLVVGLAVYEGLCRSPLGRNEAILGAVLLVALAAAAWGLSRLFSGRGAFLHYGALLGTIMAGNVAHVIIPGQRRMAEAIRQGRAPDARDARMAHQRSRHNTYLALPVVFAMLSNHYAVAYGSRSSWLLLVALTAAGILVRAWFVLRHKGRAPVSLWLAAALLVATAAALVAPVRQPPPASVDFSEVQRVVEKHCAVCHAERPAFAGMVEAPKGVKLDSAERIRAQAPGIHAQAVLSRAMPPGNVTGLTDEERALLDRWYRASAEPPKSGR